MANAGLEVGTSGWWSAQKGVSDSLRALWGGLVHKGGIGATS